MRRREICGAELLVPPTGIIIWLNVLVLPLLITMSIIGAKSATAFPHTRPSSITPSLITEDYNHPGSLLVTFHTQKPAVVSWATDSITPITLSSPPGTPKVSPAATSSIQTACIGVTPNQINFTGVAGISDPPPQNVVLNNCGQAATWYASSSDTSWLNASPAQGNLNTGGSQTIAVTASNLQAHLPAGTYRGSLSFISGSSQATVLVTLVVLAPSWPGPSSSNHASSLTFAGQSNMVLVFWSRRITVRI
jgi:Viral BACON domain